MKAIKSAGHHWWPEGLTKFWADQQGQVHRVSFDGELIASQPRSFGVESNANRIKLSPEPSVWDSSFEDAYDRADSAFPGIVAWLQTLQTLQPSFGADRMSRQQWHVGAVADVPYPSSGALRLKAGDLVLGRSGARFDDARSSPRNAASIRRATTG